MHDGHHHHDHEDSADTPQMRKALLEYLLGHNRSHEKELDELAENLEDAGNIEAADAVRESVIYFGRGNAALERALVFLEGD
jgi:hypothetical protein